MTGRNRRPRRLGMIALAAATISLLAAPLLVHGAGGAGDPTGAEPFSGTDSQAVVAILRTEPSYRPWASPLRSPSAELESGLFALQAATGAGIFGFVIGALYGRRAARREDR